MQRLARLHTAAGGLRGALTHALAVLLVLLAAHPAPAAPDTAPFQCPANPPSQPGPDHWATPPQANVNDKVPEPCRPCDDPRNASAGACGVRRYLMSPACADGRCADSQGTFQRLVGRDFVLQYDTRYNRPDLYPRAAGENCRFIVWAADPVIGIEDVAGLSGHAFWSDAYFASQSMVEPPFAREGLAFLAQSAFNRSQHQLHIHIGTLASPYRAALAGLDPAVGDTVTRLSINGYDVRARVFSVQPDADPFAGRDVIAIARAMLPNGAADLTSHGVLAALLAGGSRLVILVAPRLDREELNYRAPEACRLR